MATVTAFLKHRFIGKTTQAQPYTAAAHARYAMRRQAMQFFYSEHMPKNYHAIQRWLVEHENGMRKNGRIEDSFIISVPRDVSEADAITALRRFGFRIGQGRTPFYFVGHGFDTNNHHVHFQFYDKDIETGRRVFGTTQRNSTAALKIEWETAANETFAQLGYDVRVKVHEGYEEEAANDNEAERGGDDVSEDSLPEPSQEPEPLVADSIEPATVEGTEPVSEDEMALSENETGYIDEQDKSATAQVQLLYRTALNRGALHQSQQALEDAERRLQLLIQQREQTAREAGKYAADSISILQDAHNAQETLKEHQKSNGKLKGIGIKLFGIDLKTPARRKAEEAERTAESRQRAASYVEKKRAEYREREDGLTTQVAQTEEEAYMRKQELERMYGNEQDIREVEDDFKNTIKQVTKEVYPDEAMQAWRDGQLTDDEIVAYVREMGDRVLMTQLQDEMGESNLVPEPSEGEDAGESL